MTVFRVLFNHWKEFITHRSKIPEGEDPREHFAEMLRRHRADNKSKKEASERRRLARLSAERKKKEKEEREKKRIEDLSRWELKRKIDNDVVMYQLGSLFETREPRKDLEMFLLRVGNLNPWPFPWIRRWERSRVASTAWKNLENDTANSSSWQVR